MVEKPPTLKPGEQECHVIAHDEVCFHANDLSRTEWVAGKEQPLRQKGRGRIVHVSDFIIEHSGRLCLTESEREAQMKLPCALDVEQTDLAEPLELIETPRPVKTLNAPTIAKMEETKKATKRGVKKERKKKETQADKPSEPTGTSAKGRTFAENSNWNPCTLSRLPSFDARRIIYPGANGDPWWDMPQLIAQVSIHSSSRFTSLKQHCSRQRMQLVYLITSFPTHEPSSSLTVRRPTNRTHLTPSLPTR